MPDPPPQGEVPRSSAAEGDAAPFDRAAHDRQVPRPAAAEGESTPTPTPSTGSRASTPAPTFPPFTPDPATADAILRDLGDPDLSFRAVAELRGTSLEALAAWFARPDIAQRAAQIESAIARRARFVAIASLSTAAKAMQTILADFLDGVHLRVDDPDAHPGLPAPRNTELLRRQAETARKAAAILLRVANFHPGPPRDRAPGAATGTHAPPQAAPPADHLARAPSGPDANARHASPDAAGPPASAEAPPATPPIPPDSRTASEQANPRQVACVSRPLGADAAPPLAPPHDSS